MNQENNFQNNNDVQNNQSLNNNNQTQNVGNNFQQSDMTQNYWQTLNQTNGQTNELSLNSSSNSNNQNFNPKKNNKMILIVVGVVILLIVAVAIYFMFLKKEQSNSNNNQNSNSNINVNDELDDNNKNETNIKIVSAPGQKIYVDCPTSLRTKNRPRTLIMYNSRSSLIGLTFLKANEFEGNIENVVSSINDSFFKDISGYSDGELDGSKIKVINQEYIKVGNYNCIKFVGTAKNKDFDGNEWDSYVYGYSFIINDIPVAVIGIVSDKSQETNMINEIKQNVDAIASTIRTEK